MLLLTYKNRIFKILIESLILKLDLNKDNCYSFLVIKCIIKIIACYNFWNLYNLISIIQLDRRGVSLLIFLNNIYTHIV